MPKAEKKTKAKKDPNAPKKGLSAFMIFSQENREKTKKENPSATFGIWKPVLWHILLGELGKLLGSAWRELSEEEKEPYNKKAQTDKDRYERENLAYKNAEAKSKSKSPSPAPASPKSPKSPKKD
jgi:hypothetical protein